MLLKKLNNKIVFRPLTIKIIMMLALCYLLLPQIIFEIFAFRTPLAVLFFFGSVAVLFLAWRYIPEFDYSIEMPVYVFLISEMLILLVFLISGMGGLVGSQSSDYVRSNAVLADLVNYDWPVMYNEQNNLSVLNYYIAYFIPGAAIGKVLGGSFHVAEIVTFIWSFLGMSLGVFLMYVLTEVCKLRTLWLLFFWGGLDCIGYIIVDGSLFYGTQHLEHWASIQRDYGNGHIANYMSTASNINWNPQHFIPALILVGFILLMVKNNSYKLCILATCSLLFWSPLVTVGVIPFALVLIIYEKGRIDKFISIPDLLGILFLAIPMCLYYLSMNLSSAGGRDSFIRGPEWLANNWTIVLLFIVIEFGLVGGILLCSMKKDSTLNKVLCITAIAWMTICLFIDYGECHDFSMRATVIAWYVLFSFSPRLLETSGNKYKKYLIYYMIGATITCSTEYVRMLDGVRENGFNAVRAENEKNTISGWDIQYQYVGSPNSFFFNKLCGLNYNKNAYIAELLSVGDSYIVYKDNRWTIYAYQNYIYVFNSQSLESSVTVDKIGGTSGGSKEVYDAGKQYKYGTLSEIAGLSRIALDEREFDSVNIVLKDESGEVYQTWTRADITNMMLHTYENQATVVNITDSNWMFGISNEDAQVLLFVNLPSYYEMIKSANSILYGGETYSILKIECDDIWIKVHVDRDASACEYPHVLTFQ